MRPKEYRLEARVHHAPTTKAERRKWTKKLEAMGVEKVRQLLANERHFVLPRWFAEAWLARKEFEAKPLIQRVRLSLGEFATSILAGTVIGALILLTVFAIRLVLAAILNLISW